MSTFSIEFYREPGERIAALADDVRIGLTSEPKTLPPKWFYDEAGSVLFEQITDLPEYYPTRAERAILLERAGEIAAHCGADTLVELGSGISAKTRLLLDAFTATGQLRRYVPVDVDEVTLRAAGTAVAADYPTVAVHAICADFERHLDRLPAGGRRLVAFLGSTIGNLPPAGRKGFFRDLRASLTAGDALLLGTDLVKDSRRLVAAYDDAAGITAAFNRNLLHVLNRELAAGLDPGEFDHQARWNAEQSWVEMHLVARREIHAQIAGVPVHFAAGESVRTEISAKFRRDQVAGELADADLQLAHWWTDRAGDFALSLAVCR